MVAHKVGLTTGVLWCVIDWTPSSHRIPPLHFGGLDPIPTFRHLVLHTLSDSTLSAESSPPVRILSATSRPRDGFQFLTCIFSSSFRLNAAEMFVDVQADSKGTSTQWIAESGIVDLFIFSGPSPADVQRQYAALTGTTALPQVGSLIRTVQGHVMPHWEQYHLKRLATPFRLAFF